MQVLLFPLRRSIPAGSASSRQADQVKIKTRTTGCNEIVGRHGAKKGNYTLDSPTQAYNSKKMGVDLTEDVLSPSSIIEILFALQVERIFSVKAPRSPPSGAFFFCLRMVRPIAHFCQVSVYHKSLIN
jgi:hypothetical protein